MKNSPPFVPPTIIARTLAMGLVAVWLWFFHGFIVPVLAAVIVVIATWPLYKALKMRVSSEAATASMALATVLLFIFLPVIAAVNYAVSGAAFWVGLLSKANREGIAPPAWLQNVPGVGLELESLWHDHLGPGSMGAIAQGWTSESVAGVTQFLVAAGGSLFGAGLGITFTLITVFFLYRDGEALVREIGQAGCRIFPESYDRIEKVVPQTVRSVVNGMTVIAVGEGVVLGAAYWIAGAPSPVTLGVATAAMAMFPGGAPLAVLLVSLYLMITGGTLAGSLLLAWGFAELFLVDKFIRPRLVGGPIQMPFLPTFFGLVGGVKTMGFIGLFVGPVVMALAILAWKIWRDAVPVSEPSSE